MLNLSYDWFRGEVLATIGRLAHLQVLDLSYNAFSEATGELIEPSMVGGWTWWTEDPEPFCIPAHGRNSTAPTTNSFPYLVVINYGDALAQDKQCSIDHEADAPAT
ncbi:uncharacterized protein [Zea mays]|uniref:uncharacterized protein isoform X1 n=1 Tax=Zea mays TaxID=4577 RepID=UPI0004DEC480|nr:uncharacterized protein LOC103627159 isoform X1 [Zea mays]|eukprot:XP_008645686.1 uncharacterized protein LOC103627159 isoform X1 [Zea mays]